MFTFVQTILKKINQQKKTFFLFFVLFFCCASCRDSSRLFATERVSWLITTWLWLFMTESWCIVMIVTLLRWLRKVVKSRDRVATSGFFEKPLLCWNWTAMQPSSNNFFQKTVLQPSLESCKHKIKKKLPRELCTCSSTELHHKLCDSS